MASVGAIGVYRPVSVRLPLSVWAAGNRSVSLLQKPIVHIQSLPIWAAGNRLITCQARHDAMALRTAWYVGGGVSWVTPRNGRIAGQFRVEGVPQADKMVLLFYRPTLKLIASTRTDAGGTFEFCDLYPSGRYLVLGLDDLVNAPASNALVADYVLPVTA
jgi:hypothetical protein